MTYGLVERLRNGGQTDLADMAQELVSNRPQLPDGYVLISKQVLQVVLNAFERDANAGLKPRGEMALAIRESVELGAQQYELAALKKAGAA